VLESQKNEIAQRVPKLPLKMKYDFVTINSDSDFGTADALRAVSEKIRTDVLLISCDTITNIDFYPVLNQFRTNDASCVAIFSKSPSTSQLVVPGPKTSYKQEKDLVGINDDNNRLLFLASSTDFQDNLSLPGNLLRTYGKVTIHSGLTDAHIYLVKKWVVDYLSNCDKFSTIKGELLPFIIKKQLSRAMNANNTGLSEVNFDTNDIFDFVRQDVLDQKIVETNLNNNLNAKRSATVDLIKCFAYVAPASSFCARVNTLLNYCTVNKNIINLFESLCGATTNATLISKNANVKSTQMSECAIAENATISEKTSLKSSIFGSNCFVDQKTRISDSVIMSNATIEEKVVLENSIICDKAIIKQGSVLKNCIVGHNFVVQENTTKEKAHLTGEGFMEI
jgi:translation initiation factor eIF-2B subunit gamma